MYNIRYINVAIFFIYVNSTNSFREIVSNLELSNKYSHSVIILMSTYFSNSASFWLGLQMDYDLDIAEDTLSEKIHKEVRQLAIA